MTAKLTTRKLNRTFELKNQHNVVSFNNKRAATLYYNNYSMINRTIKKKKPHGRLAPIGIDQFHQFQKLRGFNTIFDQYVPV